MKKVIRLSLIAAGLALAGTAHADLDPNSFQTSANSSFVKYFAITPDLTDDLMISVSGTNAQYSALSFSFLGGGPVFTAALSNGNWVAAFDDYFNNSLSLTGGTAYTLKIEGTTRAAIPGTFGIVSINTLGGTVTPVPEPESYAMLLAGLGLMGTIARRRSKAATA